VLFRSHSSRRRPRALESCVMDASPVSEGSYAREFYDNSIVGYLAVETKDVADITEIRGYVCSTVMGKRSPPPGLDTCHTSRAEVPYATEWGQAVSAMLKYRSHVEKSTILEIRRRGTDESEIPPDWFRSDGEKLFIAPPSHVLDKKFLSTGQFFQRGTADYATAPCPFCQGSLAGLEACRGQVGRANFIRNAFMVSPCPEEKCIKAQVQRQRRLDDPDNVRKLYHACSRATADLIKRSGGKFKCGSKGAGGGGIYFAHTPREVEWKAADRGGPSGGAEYVVFECTVRMGRGYEGSRDEDHMTFAELIQKGQYDSCILDRGGTGYPLPPPPVPGTREGCHPGYEFVVYSWDQVDILGEVPRDPVSAGF